MHRASAVLICWILVGGNAAFSQTSWLSRGDATDENAAATGESALLDRESLETLRTEIEERLAAEAAASVRAVLEGQLDEIRRAERLLGEAENPPSPPSLDPPFSLRDLDRTLERLQKLTNRRQALQSAVRSAERSLERMRRLLADVRRRATEGSAADEAVSLEMERERLVRFELRNSRLELELAEEAIDRLTRAAREKQRQLRVDEEDLTARKEEYAQLRADLETRRVEVERQLLDAGDDRRAVLLRRLEILDAREAHLLAAAEAWTLRYRLAVGEMDASEEEGRARRQLARQLGDLGYERDMSVAEQERLRSLLQIRDRESADVPERASIRERIELEEEYIAFLDRQIASHERYIDAFGSGSVAGNLGRGVSALGDSLLRAWNLQVTTVDDRAITVGKIVLALTLFLLGIVVSRVLSAQLRRRLFDRMSMDRSMAASLQTLSLYVFVLLFFLTALRFVSIPLTALTFVGGALAIGIGFGSQNIVNNFISGLILMAERPIKVGDMIDVGGTYGRVERIGGRSTRVRSGDNTHVIVPNSTFLEKEVLNWTVSDTKIRTYVDVGVAYGSPVREVIRLLGHAVKDHGKILDRPAPEVLFMSFGDNALEFRIYFWIQLRQILDRLRLQSDVRIRINSLFREAGITIAFPQRDVHLDTTEPLEVRVSAPQETPPQNEG